MGEQFCHLSQWTWLSSITFLNFPKKLGQIITLKKAGFSICKESGKELLSINWQSFRVGLLWILVPQQKTQRPFLLKCSHCLLENTNLTSILTSFKERHSRVSFR